MIITEHPSLLASLLKSSASESTIANVAKPDGNFPGKLDAFLNESGQVAQSDTSAAVALANSLNLQMLRTTMSLAIDDSEAFPSPSIFDRQSAVINSLIKAYNSNFAAGEQATVLQATPSLPQPAQSPVTKVADDSPPVLPQKGNEWLDPVIAKASSKYGVEVGLIKAVIKAESNFNPNAVSHAGARGLMQLMPGTARALGVNDSFDPEQNVMAGTKFLGELLTKYDGNIDSALAAYNWGPGNVDRRPERLPQETRQYLAKVKQLYSSYSV